MSDVGAVAAMMSLYSYRFANEAELQQAIARVLEEAGLEVERERPVGRRDRLDLWLPRSGIAIEVKVAGSLPTAMRQVERYLALPEVTGVVLAGARSWARGATVSELPKPFALCYLRSTM